MAKIYKLVDPNTREPRYIGFTIKPLIERRDEHINQSKRGIKSHKCNWIRKLLKNNQIPIIKRIKKITLDNWEYWEIYFIAKYRKLGHNLTNLTDGGEGGLGRKVSKEEREATSKRHKGNKYWLGKTHTTKTLKKMSKSRKANITPEFRKSVTEMNKKRLGKLNPRSTPIKGVHIKTGKVRKFISMREAESILSAEGIKIKRVRISKCINGHKTRSGKYLVKSAGGFKWYKINTK